ncbi:MAG: AbiTii domain-containing protein [Pseudomarimonas sp.]
MSLLREIQAEAMSDGDIATLLRKCKVLAFRLSNHEFKAWVDNELNGYSDVDELPKYRIFHVESYGHFSGPFGSGIKNGPIPPLALPAHYREFASTSRMAQPVSAYSSLLREGKRNNFQEQWPANLTALVSRDIYQNMACGAAWKLIPYNAVASLVDTIRTRVLNFCLEIEALAPAAGEASINSSPVSQERVTQVFHTHINGTVQNLSSGGSNFSQSASINTNADAIFTSLLQALSSAGIGTPEKNAASVAVSMMKDSYGTSDFTDRYRSFMSVVADHMQVLGPVVAPFLGPVAGLIS